MSIDQLYLSGLVYVSCLCNSLFIAPEEQQWKRQVGGSLNLYVLITFVLDSCLLFGSELCSVLNHYFPLPRFGFLHVIKEQK